MNFSIFWIIVFLFKGLVSIHFYPEKSNLEKAILIGTFEGGVDTNIFTQDKIQEDGYLIELRYVRKNAHNCYLGIWRNKGVNSYQLVFHFAIPQGALNKVLTLTFQNPSLLRRNDIFGIHVKNVHSDKHCVSRINDVHPEYPFNQRYWTHGTANLYDIKTFQYTEYTRFYLMIAAVQKNILNQVAVRYNSNQAIFKNSPVFFDSSNDHASFKTIRLQLHICSKVTQILFISSVMPAAKVSFYVGQGLADQLRKELCNIFDPVAGKYTEIVNTLVYLNLPCKSSLHGRTVVIKADLQITFQRIYVIGEPSSEKGFFLLPLYGMSLSPNDFECKDISCLDICKSLNNCTGMTVQNQERYLHFRDLESENLIYNSKSSFFYKTCISPLVGDFC